MENAVGQERLKITQGENCATKVPSMMDKRVCMTAISRDDESQICRKAGFYHPRFLSGA